jgi:predicted AlkP superfamily phosphohydrolase/phosphomutase
LVKTKEGNQRKLAKYKKYIVEWSKENLPLRDWVKKYLPIKVREQISSMRTLAGAIDWKETRAYRVKLSHPVEGININLMGRQPNGTVSHEEYEKLRTYIIEKLIDLVDPETKEKLVKEVYRKEDIYSGRCMHNIPDIIVILGDRYDGGYNLDRMISPVPRSFLNEFSGYHTMNGIFIINGQEIETGKTLDRINMIDLAPTIMYYMGLPVPEGMDGRVIQEIFKGSYLDNNPVIYEKKDIDLSSDKTTQLSKDEKEDIKKALEGLGYV